MDSLTIHLALHGVLVLTVSIFGGVLLWRVMLKQQNEAPWHLVHAGGTVRGVMLIALAAVIDMLALPPWQVAAFVWVIIFSVWVSMAAMIIAAVRGDKGIRLHGPGGNRVVYVLYGLHVITIFPACAFLIYGLLRAL